VAWVQTPVVTRPTFSVEKLALFCNPASETTFPNTAIKIIHRLKFAAAKQRCFRILRPGSA
jgi:hypothetical protein